MRQSHLTRRIVVTGPATADEAWECYRVIDRWTDWAPHLTSVGASSPTLAAGVTGEATALGFVPTRFRVLAVDERSRTWSWVVCIGPIELHLDHDVAAVPRGSRAGLTLTGPALFVLPYEPLASWALHRLVHARG